MDLLLCKRQPFVCQAAMNVLLEIIDMLSKKNLQMGPQILK